jgi:23S rRNA G2445 N2-methylase RlmL
MIEAIARCITGLEEITQKEIKELTKAKSEVLDKSIIKFKVKDEKVLANFTYNTRSSTKVYELITHFNFKDIDDLIEKVRKIKFPKIKSPFAVRCERMGEHNFDSNSIEIEVGSIINKDDKLKVDLKDPTERIIVEIINDFCLIGIDYSGIKLSKRSYRIKLIQNPINPCVAYAMIRLSEIKSTDSILDPFCKSGEIPIETAIYLSNIPPNEKNIENLAFTKLLKFTPKVKKNKIKNKIFGVDYLQNNLRSGEINSKIAGVEKLIKFSRVDLDWIDTKFKENSVSKIITFPIYSTNLLPKDKVEKVYESLFYQGAFIMKKNSTITILTPEADLIEKYAKKHKFKKEAEYPVKTANMDLKILIYRNQ